MAISIKYHEKGIGREIVKYVEGCALSLNEKSHIGCRFITVDAYPQSIGFYQKLGFVFNKSKVYREKEHPSMRLDVYREQWGQPLKLQII